MIILMGLVQDGSGGQLTRHDGPGARRVREKSQLSWACTRNDLYIMKMPSTEKGHDKRLDIL